MHSHCEGIFRLDLQMNYSSYGICPLRVKETEMNMYNITSRFVRSLSKGLMGLLLLLALQPLAPAQMTLNQVTDNMTTSSFDYGRAMAYVGNKIMVVSGQDSSGGFFNVQEALGGVGYGGGYTVHGGASKPNYAYALAGGLDYDNDGIPDFLVGSPYLGSNSGKVQIWSAAPWIGLLKDITGGASTDDKAGMSVANVGLFNTTDFNPDFAFGKPGKDYGGVTDVGCVVVRSGDMNSTNKVLAKFYGKNANERLGYGVTAIDDLNGDGYMEIACYGPGGNGQGVVRVFSGLSATQIYKRSGSSANQKFGKAIALTADFDNDGLRDVAISSLNHPMGAVVHIVSAADILAGNNTAPDIVVITDPSGSTTSRFGKVLIPGPEVISAANDQSSDLMITDHKNDVAYVYRIKPDPAGLASATPVWVNTLNGVIGSKFGYSGTYIGDLNPSSVGGLIISCPEVAVGAPLEPINNDLGSVSILSNNFMFESKSAPFVAEAPTLALSDVGRVGQITLTSLNGTPGNIGYLLIGGLAFPPQLFGPGLELYISPLYGSPTPIGNWNINGQIRLPGIPFSPGMSGVQIFTQVIGSSGTGSVQSTNAFMVEL